MSTLKKCKVVMLPTEKASSIHTNPKKMVKWHMDIIPTNKDCVNRYLYILSDEEPKEGDWVLGGLNGTSIKQYGRFFAEDWKKIIATTDTSLKIPKPQPNSLDMFCKLEETLPQPSEGFLNKFVEEYNIGNIITEVLVEYVETDQVVKRFEGDEGYDSSMTTLKVNPKDNTITIKKAKDSWTREEMDSHVIAFATWYSGMKEASVRRAYERFKKEIIT